MHHGQYLQRLPFGKTGTPQRAGGDAHDENCHVLGLWLGSWQVLMTSVQRVAEALPGAGVEARRMEAQRPPCWSFSAGSHPAPLPSVHLGPCPPHVLRARGEVLAEGAEAGPTPPSRSPLLGCVCPHGPSHGPSASAAVPGLETPCLPLPRGPRRVRVRGVGSAPVGSLNPAHSVQSSPGNPGVCHLEPAGIPLTAHQPRSQIVWNVEQRRSRTWDPWEPSTLSGRWKWGSAQLGPCGALSRGHRPARLDSPTGLTSVPV